jgi:hypothetical protein
VRVSADPTRDYCLFRSSDIERPTNKSVAVSNDVLGGVVIGGSGTIAAAQVSMY